MCALRRVTDLQNGGKCALRRVTDLQKEDILCTEECNRPAERRLVYT